MLGSSWYWHLALHQTFQRGVEVTLVLATAYLRIWSTRNYYCCPFAKPVTFPSCWWKYPMNKTTLLRSRVWWLFVMRGHLRVFVLVGGTHKWENSRRGMGASRWCLRCSEFRCSYWRCSRDNAEAVTSHDTPLAWGNICLRRREAASYVHLQQVSHGLTQLFELLMCSSECHAYCLSTPPYERPLGQKCFA